MNQNSQKRRLKGGFSQALFQCHLTFILMRHIQDRGVCVQNCLTGPLSACLERLRRFHHRIEWTTTFQISLKKLLWCVQHHISAHIANKAILRTELLVARSYFQLLLKELEGCPGSAGIVQLQFFSVSQTRESLNIRNTKSKETGVAQWSFLPPLDHTFYLNPS